MRRTILTACGTAALLLSLTSVVQAQEAPEFIQKTMPARAVNAAFKEYQAVMEDGALDQKTKELIGLGVAAQVPCSYCVEYHTEAARSLGASDAEIKEATATAAQVRQWSTMLNGSQYDMASWRKEVEAMFEE